jgi:hypothetical protein
MSDFGVEYTHVSLQCDSTSAISVAKNPVLLEPHMVLMGAVNALIKGEIEDHVWFEDRWMVASLCDE